MLELHDFCELVNFKFTAVQNIMYVHSALILAAVFTVTNFITTCTSFVLSKYSSKPYVLPSFKCSTGNIQGDIDDDMIDRADEEEQLMKKTVSTKFEESSTASIVSDIRTNGVARINNVLSSALVKELLNFINLELKNSLDGISIDKLVRSDIFTSIKSNNNRWDMKLPINDLVQKVMKVLLKSGSVLGDALSDLVGEDGGLFELSSFITVNGSKRQIIHSDTLWSKQPSTFTCTLSLQDICEDMGPTVFIPGTHTEDAYIRRVYEANDSIISSSPHTLSTLNSGDIAIYDSRLLHCGGSNRSDKQRVLFYFSFKNLSKNKNYVSVGSGTVSATAERLSAMNGASMRSQYKGQFILSDFRN